MSDSNYKILIEAFGKSAERIRTDYVSLTWQLIATVQERRADHVI